MNPVLLQFMLESFDKQLAADSKSVQSRFYRAYVLTQMGRVNEAIDEYIHLLKQDATHAGALNNLGKLLYETKRPSAAKLAFKEAVAQHPRDALAHANLAELLMEAGELAEARHHYELAIQLNPGCSQAHRGLSYVLWELGDEQQAAIHREIGFRSHPIMVYPYHGEQPPVSLLLLASAIGGNVPFKNFLDNNIFQTYVVFVEFCTSNTVLPAHQFVLNGIGDADMSAPALDVAMSIIQRTTAPVVNSPSAVLATRRAANAKRFLEVPGVIIPRMNVMLRENLESAGAVNSLAQLGFEFPILLRTPGYHTGKHFLKVESPGDVSSALQETPGRELLVIQYIESRSPDGNFRKYRVMMIQGQLYPLHLAISSDWKVHYFSAEMVNHHEFRLEEAEFLNDMPRVLGSRAMTALAKIQEILGLDYCGVDFALTPEGDVILFEANATMVVNPPESDECWDYRRSSVDLIEQAVRKMLLGTAGRPAITTEL